MKITRKHILVYLAVAGAIYYVTQRKKKAAATGATVLFAGDTDTGMGRVLRMPSDVLEAADQRSQLQNYMLRDEALSASHNPLA